MTRRTAVYLLANKRNGTIYTGVTSDLGRRIWQHREHLASGFCTRYNIDRLVYFECFDDIYTAISREKQIKGGSRAAKIRLIESMNPDWRDLYEEIL